MSDYNVKPAFSASKLASLQICKRARVIHCRRTRHRSDGENQLGKGFVAGDLRTEVVKSGIITSTLKIRILLIKKYAFIILIINYRI